MANKPIMFSSQMVRALLDGRKTQTRRITKIQDDIHVDGKGGWLYPGFLPVSAGDRLWVREGWQTAPAYDDLKPSEMAGDESILYAADGVWESWGWGDLGCIDGGRKRPSMFMPRWASRLTLIATDVRVQRLQEISGEDCIAEGVTCETCAATWSFGRSACNQRGCFEIRQNFRDLWNSLNGPDAWDANPWIARISFDVHRGNIDQIGRDA
jgi:hypothetical protein